MAACRIAFILTLFSSTLCAQGNRYVVFFKDKNSNPFSISQPEAFLSAKAIARRNKSAIAVNQEDLPVTPSYVTQVKNATGTPADVKVFFTSKWMNALLIETTPASLSSITALPMVARAELVAPGTKLIGGRVKQLKMKNSTGAAQATRTQLQMIGLDKMHSDGIFGEGIMVSIFDGGFQGVNTAAPFQSIYAEGRMKLVKDFVTNSSNVYQFDKHGTQVFSVIAAIADNYEGGAYKSNYNLFLTEDISSEYRIEEYNWTFAAEKADSAGTDIIQSSLGYNLFDDPTMDYTIANLDGKTAVISKAAAMARDRAIIVVVSAGNEGAKEWSLVTPPADVDGILATGAVNNAGLKVNFSSFGPTADGRIKPDVVALGLSTATILPSGAVGSESGTSLAAPLITSLVAGLLQAYPQLKPAEVVLAIRLSADKAANPDNRLGYGLPNYTAVKNYLESNASGDAVAIYPNPAADSLRLSFKDLPSGPVELSFYDQQGKLLSNPVLYTTWLDNPTTISIANLSAGVYILKVRTSTVIKTFRFVKL
ncbi:MAG: S8 family serine peptidase [Cyclobacteriaceae bacterium]|nr:S8 family serine peptidase [Cyclobacteriaceae bacterium]